MQLSATMFIQYFIQGPWYVTIDTYLGYALKFTEVQIGLVYGTAAFAPIHLRNSPQGLIAFATYGVGNNWERWLPVI
ncbi:hypothetical protein [Parabacteroides sp. Marseille-P3160]|uniref:hypothetical protein n=1 Tax=Parabacteroides sp. Marseille-P3160 TaxID=1917887 RepID=UPI00135B8415|nr:hypothetical protein [Parabacteroides sp. Marseille-P3160]